MLFYSESHVRLTEASQCIMGFLKPLEWGMVYIPVLPATMVRARAHLYDKKSHAISSRTG